MAPQSEVHGNREPWLYGVQPGQTQLSPGPVQAQAQEILHRLIEGVDVVLVNNRPDVAAKLGVDYESLARVNPRIVYCEVTAYGREGPDAHRPGYDMIIQALSGLMASETKQENGVPQQIWSTPLIDTNCGVNMVGCICAALVRPGTHRQGSKD